MLGTSRLLIALATSSLAWAVPAARAQAPASSPDEVEARLTEVKGGEVTAFLTEEPEGVPAAADMPLSVGDRVKTGDGASAEISFDGQTCISLQPNSEFKLTSLQRAEPEVGLTWGSLLAKVQALAGGTFRVRTPAAVAAVRGTEFGVEVFGAEGSEATVGVFDEGKVEVTGQAGHAEMLKANQETTVKRGGGPLAAHQLRRFVRHRQFMRGQMRRRSSAVRKAWRSLSVSQRRQLRGEKVKLMRQQRQRDLEQRKELQQRKGRKVRPPSSDKEKLDRIKKAIRERKGRGRP